MIRQSKVNHMHAMSGKRTCVSRKTEVDGSSVEYSTGGWSSFIRSRPVSGVPVQRRQPIVSPPLTGAACKPRANVLWLPLEWVGMHSVYGKSYWNWQRAWYDGCRFFTLNGTWAGIAEANEPKLDHHEHIHSAATTIDDKLLLFRSYKLYDRCRRSLSYMI